MARKHPAQLLKFSLSLFCLAAFAGCETPSPVVSGGRAVVAVLNAPFYKYGPAQTFGPDFLLKQDTRVTILKRDWAFTRVMTDDGTAGYIASEDLKAAPPEPPAQPAGSSSGVRTTSSGKPRRSNVQSVPDSPLFDMSDVPALPPDELPKPAPDFRF